MTTTDDDKPAPALTLSRRDALFFDLDGTLLDFAASPEEVAVPADLPPTIGRLSATLGGAVAIITGRDMDFVERIFGGPAIAASASHGAALRRAPGAPAEVLAARPDFGLLEDIARQSRPAQLPEGVWIEKKGFACAFHFRTAASVAVAPQGAQAITRLVRAWAKAVCAGYNGNFSEAGRLSLTEGDMVVELSPHGVDKGTALEIFMGMAPFKGRRPVFFGDAEADRPGMEAARRNRDGITGKAVAVGRQAAAHADLTVASPQELRALLKRQPCL